MAAIGKETIYKSTKIGRKVEDNEKGSKLGMVNEIQRGRKDKQCMQCEGHTCVCM